ncbi:hypothetical protein F2Q69_00003578 [Brassica cretica]|uniref:Uncharacterized protein n=1 Tax=Brassica cretica TaxID=69181 RepID=A0A8S9PGG0_BRACR|nr:hypothetical protein F2Q69_00003578 [Brassica cretica]
MRSGRGSPSGRTGLWWQPPSEFDSPHAETTLPLLDTKAFLQPLSSPPPSAPASIQFAQPSSLTSICSTQVAVIMKLRLHPTNAARVQLPDGSLLNEGLGGLRFV